MPASEYTIVRSSTHSGLFDVVVDGQPVFSDSLELCQRFVIGVLEIEDEIDSEIDLRRAERGQIDNGSLTQLYSPPSDWGHFHQ